METSGALLLQISLCYQPNESWRYIKCLAFLEGVRTHTVVISSVSTYHFKEVHITNTIRQEMEAKEIIELKAKLMIKMAEFELECKNRIADNDHDESRQRAKEDMKAQITRQQQQLEERYTENRFNHFDMANGGPGDSSKRPTRQDIDPFVKKRRKRPQTISGPYIVYSLRDDEVKEDWEKIMGLRSRGGLLSNAAAAMEHTDHQPGRFSARYDNGRLIYENECFACNDYIQLDEQSPDGAHIHSARVQIIGVQSCGILIKNKAGARSGVSLKCLQVGRYKLTHVEK